MMVLKSEEREKQIGFMEHYKPIHENFVRFCQARSFGVMEYEDLVNESILRAYKAWDSVRKPDALLYFLFGTARNIVMNTIRKRTEERLNHSHRDLEKTYNSAEGNLEIEYLYQKLNCLSDPKKEALILFEISGFSIREIAEIQESTEGAVKVMLSRARKELKELIEENDASLEHKLTA